MGRAVLSPFLAGLVLAGCGGGGEDRVATVTVPTQTTERRPAPSSPLTPPGSAQDPLLAPRGIPRVGLEAADPAEVRVLDRWLRAIRQGRTDSAARLFAPDAKVQNGTPVLTLRTPAEREAWVASLPCGARIADVEAARGYLVVVYELTDRAGADCGSGVGGSARGAVKVEGGKIAEWYRLEELPRVGRDVPGVSA